MPVKNKLHTIKKFSEYKFKEKASQFIGLAYPVETEDEAKDKLEEIKKEYYDARHHCYAWQINKNDTSKYSDDGEPNGTAGIRIFNAIQHFNLTNVLVVSVRYFGGIKLGVGPLGKAYYNSAFGALSNSEIIIKLKYFMIKIKYEYNHTKHIHHFLNTYQANILDNSFENKPVITCLIQPGIFDDLKKKLNEATKAQIDFELLNDSVWI